MNKIFAEKGQRQRPALSRVKPILINQRTLLAFKAAVAVGLAWEIAPLMPGVLDEYPYYAPLGALLCMHQTVAHSFKYGLQILAGLGIGLLLATGVLLFGAPNLLTISLVVAVGVLIGSMRWLGAPGQEYLPIAALFVLIVGGQRANIYSIGYLVQMTTGVVVALVTNAVIIPPLAFDAAVDTFSRFRTGLARHLNNVGEALKENWPPEREDWARQNEALAATADEVRTAIYTADESRKANHRARRHRRDIAGDFNDLHALENITFHIRDLTEVLAGAAWGKPFPFHLSADLREPLSGAIQKTAEALQAWDTGSTDTAVLDEAEDVLETLAVQLDEHQSSEAASTSAAVMVTMTLRRILAAIRPRMEQSANKQPTGR
ncbi:FUSC family protein [Arthrobacter sp. H14]|uniref:FUSC family protein n=1 Tax=Arthrobacter sp. H14 TaxID=1312959 RepID=UPI00047ADC48|nr:hypothetical protein [Arthrobacter sp. H14]